VRLLTFSIPENIRDPRLSPFRKFLRGETVFSIISLASLKAALRSAFSLLTMRDSARTDKLFQETNSASKVRSFTMLNHGKRKKTLPERYVSGHVLST
jgi:hypothetical protein